MLRSAAAATMICAWVLFPLRLDSPPVASAVSDAEATEVVGGCHAILWLGSPVHCPGWQCFCKLNPGWVQVDDCAGVEPCPAVQGHKVECPCACGCGTTYVAFINTCTGTPNCPP